MNFDLEKLYNLLPALYRLRDTELGIQLQATLGNPAAEQEAYGPLKALLSVIAEQVEVLEEDLDRLYDDQFIETCSEWAVSYIGGLVGMKGLLAIPDAPFSERSQVANTIAYRRRKGTASVIEQLARDITAWDANVVEFFQRLATTQYMNHLRPENLSISGLRNWKTLNYANTPFDEMAHTADVRRIEPRRGRYNISNIGVFLWRIGSHQLINAPAYQVDLFRYTFDALGKNTPLYTLPETESEITHLATPDNVPMPMQRRILAERLEAWYGQEAGGVDADARDKSILIFADGQPLMPMPGLLVSDIIAACNLSDDPTLPGTWIHPPTDKIAIDPVLGRIALPPLPPDGLQPSTLPSPWPPSEMRVTYCYGFSANMGGGGYDRSASISTEANKSVPGASALSIQQALDELTSELAALQASNTLKTEAHGIIEIEDNSYYFETPVIRAGKGQTIELRAKNQQRPIVVLNGGELRVEGGEGSRVILNGILFSGGQLHVPETCSDGSDNQLQVLEIRHCTLLPSLSPAFMLAESPPNPLPAEAAVTPRLLAELPSLKVYLEKSIAGGLRTVEGTSVTITDSIVDALERSNVAFAAPDGELAGGTLTVLNSTIIGKVHTHTLEMASNSLFLAEKVASGDTWVGPVLARRLQHGCARFSWFPPGAKVPRRYKCLPEREADSTVIQPVFTSLRYGDAGYYQLHRYCPQEIATGADDESEMGAFHHLFQPQRVANLRTRLDEYLRFGLEAGIFFAS